MYKINCLNKISETGLGLFTDHYVNVDRHEDANGIIVRSAKMHDMDLPNTIEAIARAGAGVNNIPLEKCAEKGIVVFNTPGANANGVKEMVLATMIMAARNLIGGVNWVTSCQADPDVANLVEKNKAKFVGSEIKGKKLGVIGLGAVGILVANAANKLEMEVYGYDPFISVEHAWKLSKFIKPIKSVDDIFRECDFITVHVPLSDSTKGMFNKNAFEQMKDGVVLLNFSRDTLVEEDMLIEALKTGKVAKYVTDFPNPKVCGTEGVIAIPHLGASTAESEENCAVMAVEQMMNYLEKGNIKNSVNYPNCDMGICNQAARIAINHKNIPNMLGQFTSTLAKENVNISDLMNKSKGGYAYTLIDIESPASPEMITKLREIEGVLRVRVIE
ncbi:phosphoglycerate dehydrogenase-like oxidoreductase [Desulfitobacterium dichloroeliminans LMG P-21439]|uniref:D-3-phosphoglycerate dehydrogenase n=1 Tax=Desulfitobacterium dichloroeliminans (strain LMG P-21439 / DCA1) TaxID=871963 RepID=L0FCH0_DESDL|nr:phosphoglycerate dehydrogenase [Desulfitobacterium dichloroeliminans]AGA70710.1 phosphoglycerate dehydrogenase-like oxidoreductase [Desulfitobacterium dichloroeliminans LMG P-21439]